MAKHLTELRDLRASSKLSAASQQMVFGGIDTSPTQMFTINGDGLVRVNSNGTNDTSFNLGVNATEAQAVALQPMEK